MKNCIYFLLFLLSINCLGQRVNLSGRVVDVNNQPIAFATIVLKVGVDSAFAKAGTSQPDGTFKLEDVLVKTYILEISTLGFESYKTTINLTASTNLGDIILNEKAESLAAVTVTATKPLVQVLADKTIFNVENTINATGTNGWELLRKAPGVVLDNNNNVILEGKTGVQLWIEGRPSQLQGADLEGYLSALQASDIEKIELITQPSSRYDAAGVAGIINIVLKKNRGYGTNGTATAGVTQGDFLRSNAGLTFNNRSNIGNMYGSYSNSLGSSTGFLYLDRTQNGTNFNARTNSVYNRKTHNARLGYDYQLNSRNTVGVILNATINNGLNTSNSRTPIRDVTATTPAEVLIAQNRNDALSATYTANLNYKYADTTGHVFNVDVDYTKYGNETLSYQPNVYFNGDESAVLRSNITQQDTPISIDIAAVRLDYEQRLWKGVFATGVKVAAIDTDNTFDFFTDQNGTFIQDPNQSNTFNYQERIYAAYLNYNLSFKKWTAQAGLRVEHTNSIGILSSMQDTGNNRVARNYTNAFLSGGFSYQSSANSQWALNYSQRIQRPNYSTLNPFEYRIDDLSARRGNPFLQPQYTDNIKVSHTYKYKYTTAVSYSYIADFFAQVTEASGTDSNFINTRNVANQEVLNLSLSYPFSIKKWWNNYLSVNATYVDFKATNSDFISTSQETLGFYAQSTFTLPQEYTLEISGWYSSPSVWGGTYNTKALGSLNLAAQKKYLDNNLLVRLAFNDVLFTSRWQGTTQFGDLFINGRGGGDSRNVTVSLTYKFGNNEVKKARSRDTSAEEEKSRVN
ncbi:MAG: TonB-dependent receptor [Nonlabens sp.]|nr:TonB-dependent receptor [Nonlabens sp.]